jgi:hypothetical protein
MSRVCITIAGTVLLGCGDAVVYSQISRLTWQRMRRLIDYWLPRAHPASAPKVGAQCGSPARWETISVHKKGRFRSFITAMRERCYPEVRVAVRSGCAVDGRDARTGVLPSESFAQHSGPGLET